MDYLSIEKCDWYFGFAEQAAKKSPDAETKVGAVLVNNKTGAVIAMGFNGFIRGACDILLPKTRPDKYVYMVHGEVNLIANCARHGISELEVVKFYVKNSNNYNMSISTVRYNNEI